VHRSEQSLLLCYAVSVFNGPSPIVRSLKSEADETKAVGAWIAEQAKSRVIPHEFGVFVAPKRSQPVRGRQGQSPGQKTHRRGSLDRIWGPSSGTGAGTCLCCDPLAIALTAAAFGAAIDCLFWSAVPSIAAVLTPSSGTAP
jgi:hypothetical protein